MANYLLLRDNKESGPYTMDELVNFGLKPYDLVWVQGKSAAWRYPSEVQELKPYAPVVEEQPYDRFYKKDTEEKKEEVPAAKSRSNYSPAPREEVPLMNEYSRYIPDEKKEEIKFTAKKSVFVTLPGQQQPTAKKNSQPVQAIVEAATPSPTISISESPAVAEIKYSQPLDEIKERYVKTLLERKDKKAKKGLIINWLKKAAVFGGLIVLGVLAGFVIKSKPGKEDKVVQQMLQASPLVNNAAELSSPESFPQDENPAIKAPVGKIVNDDQLEPLQKIKESVRINEEQEPTTVRIRKETMLIVPKEKEAGSTRQFSQEPVETDPLTGERNRKLRNNNTVSSTGEKAVMKSGKNGLFDLVSVASNDYKRVAFGGIRNLYLTVTNNSKYELDNVIVELQYLKPSEEPLRTENIKFRSVAPNASATIRVPDTNRGIKVSYKIITIDSKQNSDAVAGM
ncbi:MAG: hypothetical protein ACXWC7_08130 [Chitinophagaceae bacterium]